MSGRRLLAGSRVVRCLPRRMLGNGSGLIVIAIVIGGYLVVALVAPERF